MTPLTIGFIADDSQYNAGVNRMEQRNRQFAEKAQQDAQKAASATAQAGKAAQGQAESGGAFELVPEGHDGSFVHGIRRGLFGRHIGHGAAFFVGLEIAREVKQVAQEIVRETNEGRESIQAAAFAAGETGRYGKSFFEQLAPSTEDIAEKFHQPLAPIGELAAKLAEAGVPAKAFFSTLEEIQRIAVASGRTAGQVFDQLVAKVKELPQELRGGALAQLAEIRARGIKPPEDDLLPHPVLGAARLGREIYEAFKGKPEQETQAEALKKEIEQRNLIEKLIAESPAGRARLIESNLAESHSNETLAASISKLREEHEQRTAAIEQARQKQSAALISDPDKAAAEERSIAATTRTNQLSSVMRQVEDAQRAFKAANEDLARVQAKTREAFETVGQSDIEKHATVLEEATQKANDIRQKLELLAQEGGTQISVDVTGQPVAPFTPQSRYPHEAERDIDRAGNRQATSERLTGELAQAVKEEKDAQKAYEAARAEGFARFLKDNPELKKQYDKALDDAKKRGTDLTNAEERAKDGREEIEKAYAATVEGIEGRLKKAKEQRLASVTAAEESYRDASTRIAQDEEGKRLQIASQESTLTVRQRAEAQLSLVRLDEKHAQDRLLIAVENENKLQAQIEDKLRDRESLETQAEVRSLSLKRQAAQSELDIVRAARKAAEQEKGVVVEGNRLSDSERLKKEREDRKKEREQAREDQRQFRRLTEEGAEIPSDLAERIRKHPPTPPKAGERGSPFEPLDVLRERMAGELPRQGELPKQGRLPKPEDEDAEVRMAKRLKEPILNVASMTAPDAKVTVTGNATFPNAVVERPRSEDEPTTRQEQPEQQPRVEPTTPPASAPERIIEQERERIQEREQPPPIMRQELPSPQPEKIEQQKQPVEEATEPRFIILHPERETEESAGRKQQQTAEREQSQPEGPEREVRENLIERESQRVEIREQKIEKIETQRQPVENREESIPVIARVLKEPEEVGERQRQQLEEREQPQSSSENTAQRILGIAERAAQESALAARGRYSEAERLIPAQQVPAIQPKADVPGQGPLQVDSFNAPNATVQTGPVAVLNIQTANVAMGQSPAVAAQDPAVARR